MISGALANECEQRELWQYAGLCYLAAARCQGILENSSSEINLLVKAGRQFLTAEKKNNDIGCPSIGQENIQVFIHDLQYKYMYCICIENKKEKLKLSAYILGSY